MFSLKSYGKRVFSFPKLTNMASDRIFWPDFMRAFAAISVIIIHVSGILTYMWNNSFVPKSFWHIGNVYNGFFRMAVSLFVMLSGAFLLGKKESYGDFFKNRFKRILSAFFLWALIYMFLNIHVQKIQITFGLAVKEIIQGPIFGHFWFLYMLLGLYLFTPVLRILVQNSRKKDLYYFLILAFTVTSIYPLVEKFTGIKIRLELPFVTGFIGYYVLGYLLKDQENSKKGLILWGVVFLLSAAATAIGTYCLTSRIAELDDYFYHPLALNIVLLSLSSFKLLKQLGEWLGRRMGIVFKKSIVLISNLSYGIYLAHMLALYIIRMGVLGFKLTEVSFYPVWSVLLLSLGVFLLSLFMSFMLEKFKLLWDILLIAVMVGLVISFMNPYEKKKNLSLSVEQQQQLQEMEKKLMGTWQFVGNQEGEKLINPVSLDIKMQLKPGGFVVMIQKGSKREGRYVLTLNSFTLQSTSGIVKQMKIKKLTEKELLFFDPMEKKYPFWQKTSDE